MTPISGPAIACISSGSTPPMALPTRSATGSTRSFQTGRVASIHSARLHATAVPAPEGNSVEESSHRSASRTASATAERSAALTERSLLFPSTGSATTVWRAMSLASSQFTGPPSKDSIWPSCWNAAPRSLGLRPPSMAPKGLSAPGAPPGAPMPKSAPNGLPAPNPKGCWGVGPGSAWPPAPSPSLSLSRLALPSSGSSGGTPNPKGRSLTGSSIWSAVTRVVWREKSAGPGRCVESKLTAGERLPRGLARAGCTAGPSPRAGWSVRNTRTYAHKLTVEDGR